MGVVNQLKVISNAVIDVIYPNNCAICSIGLYTTESFLCLNCKYDLPYINQSEQAKSALSQIFWGRVEVENIFSLLNYQKGNQTQKLLHELKYNSKKKLASHFGELLGGMIKSSNDFAFLVPVPLHKKKKQIRGYNQATMIAHGMSKACNIPTIESVIKRNSFNESQTKYSKYDRWGNVKNIFSVVKPKLLENKHIILIDDVLTTGATIEACVKELLKVKNCKVSVATLAARI
jgi:ComF family protein